MALNQYSHRHRAILAPHPGTLDAVYTATTEAGPHPGPAVPQQSTGMALDPSGTLDRAVDPITFTTLQAGNVGRATLRWEYASENKRNHDPPTGISGFEFIDRTGTVNGWTSPHIARVPSTGACIVSVTKDTNSIACWRQSHAGGNRGIWEEVFAVNSEDAVSCIVPLANGRIVVLYTRVVTATTAQIAMLFSDDDGASWALGSSACLDTALTKAVTDYRRIRAVELNGLLSVLLWEADTTDTVFQYVSTDSGASLQLVETVSAADNACPDMAVSNGQIHVAWIQQGATYIRAWYRTLTSASQPLSSVEEIAVGAADANVEWGVYAAGLITTAECAILADDDGILWVYGVNFDTGVATNAVIHRCSTDGGATWTANMVNGVPAELFRGDTTTYLRDLAVAPERGRACLVHRCVAALTPAVDDSLMASFLGGWTSVAMPQDDSHAFDTPAVVGWGFTWLPIEMPDDTGALYTEVLTGDGASTITLGGSLSLTCTGANSAYFSATPTTSSDVDGGILAEWRLSVASGTARQRITISDGVNCYTVQVSITTTTATLRDLPGATDVGSVAVDATKGLVLRMAVYQPGTWGTDTGIARAWIRQDGPSAGGVVNYGPRPDRYWTQIGSTFVLVADLSATNLLAWGAIAGAGDVSYRFAAHQVGRYTAGNSTTQTRGRLIPSAASPIHIVDGLRIHGVDGPAMGGDEWDWETAHDYPIEAINPGLHPSPRKPWRATTDAGQVDIILTGAEMGWGPDDVFAVYLEGANFSTASLWRDSTATNKIMDIDLRVPDLDYLRRRKQVAPTAGGSNALFHFHEGSLVGSYCDFGGTDIRKIERCEAGAWLASGVAEDYGSARIHLEDYSGATGSGTMAIRMHRGLFAVQGIMQSTDTLMLRIPAQDTAEGYFTLGTMIVGRLRPLAWQYSRGRSRGITPNVEVTRTRGGAKRSRRMAPATETTTVAWDEGVDLTGTATVGTAPSHVTLGHSGAAAWGAPADTASMVSGIFDECDGSVIPVVLCSSIPQTTAATTTSTPITVLNPEGTFYGTFAMETLRRESRPDVRGDEMEDPGERVRFSVEFERET